MVSHSILRFHFSCAYPAIVVQVKSKKKGKLTLQCDEAWSFVEDKKNKQWIWLALDVTTREIFGVYIGKRSEEGANGLGNLYLWSIVNVRFAIQIFGQLIIRFFQTVGIEPLVKRLV